MVVPHASKAQLIKGLKDVGCKPGMNLMVHSSLKSFGTVQGGAATVIEALMETLTPEGTLVMPSFNHGAPFSSDGPGYFQPEQTPTENGAIPDAFWRLPDVHRSLNPSHPFASWGKHAKRYTELHHRSLTMGLQSPLGLLLQDDGYCILMGVDYRVNTFHHVVEVAENAPCLGKRSEVYPVILADGRKVMGRTWSWRDKACPLTDQGQYGNTMQDRGLQRSAYVAKSRSILFRLRDCFEVVQELLRTGSKPFPPCHQCPIKPRVVAQTVLSDWDEQRGELLPDSQALSYTIPDKK